jgi:hypothetical protein
MDGGVPSKSVVPMAELSRQEPRFSWKVWFIWAFSISAMFSAMIFVEEGPFQEDRYLFFAMIPFQGIFGATVYYGGYVWLRRLAFRSMLRKVSAVSLEQRTDSLQEDLEKDFFNNLVKINFKYIDRYYLQTQIQADKAFTMSAIAAFIGFAIVIAGIVQMYIGKTEPAYVTTGAGVVSQFVAAVFFYLYNKTIIKMSDYHRKLVLTQNISLAMKITQDLPDEERVAAQSGLVERLSQDVNKLLAASTDDA